MRKPSNRHQIYKPVKDDKRYAVIKVEHKNGRLQYLVATCEQLASTFQDCTILGLHTHQHEAERIAKMLQEKRKRGL